MTYLHRALFIVLYFLLNFEQSASNGVQKSKKGPVRGHQEAMGCNFSFPLLLQQI
jgi:hypothetical protein